MNPRTGRLLVVLVGLLAGIGAYVAYPLPVLAGFTGVFWLVTALLARRNAVLVRRRGSRWAGAYGGLTTLAASGAFAVTISLSLPAGLGFALGLFVLGAASTATGVGVEMANEAGRTPAGGDDASVGSAVSDGSDGDASAGPGR